MEHVLAMDLTRCQFPRWKRSKRIMHKYLERDKQNRQTKNWLKKKEHSHRLCFYQRNSLFCCNILSLTQFFFDIIWVYNVTSKTNDFYLKSSIWSFSVLYSLQRSSWEIEPFLMLKMNFWLSKIESKMSLVFKPL